jgi:hypothetical protein
MKIAVCISGQLRKLNKNLIADAFKDHDVDFYIHTWQHDLNPYYNEIQKYFTEPIYTIESYGDADSFDSIVNDQIDNNRYLYAQFYTVQKSIRLALASKKKYDLYVRTRTDVLWPMQHWTEENFNQLNLNIKNTIANAINEPHEDFDFRNDKLPIVAIGINGIYNNKIVLQDWAWGMNEAAATLIGTDTSVREFVLNVKATRKMLSRHADYPRAHSPVVWGDIFIQKGILIQESNIFNGSLLRYPEDEQNFIDGYGDIT